MSIVVPLRWRYKMRVSPILDTKWKMDFEEKFHFVITPQEKNLWKKHHLALMYQIALSVIFKEFLNLYKMWLNKSEAGMWGWMGKAGLRGTISRGYCVSRDKKEGISFLGKNSSNS